MIDRFDNYIMNKYDTAAILQMNMIQQYDTVGM